MIRKYWPLFVVMTEKSLSFLTVITLIMDKHLQQNPYIERPGQVYYNPHQQQQYTVQQPVYFEPQTVTYQQYPQQQYRSQPQTVYVQPQPRRAPRDVDESSCLVCACLTACCWATFCWPWLCI